MKIVATVLLALAFLVTETAAAAERHLLYAVRSPKAKEGFLDIHPSLGIWDIDDHHKLLRYIELPDDTVNIKAIAASAVTKRLYVAHWGEADDLGDLLCLDLVTGEVVWKRKYGPGPGADRIALTPDGKKIYWPSGETGFNSWWYVIDAESGDVLATIDHVAAPHNTLVTPDGKHAYFSSHVSHICPEHTPSPDERMIAMVDTATERVVKRLGPFRDVVRPFTINADESLLFAIVNRVIGFQVLDTASNRVLYTAVPPESITAQPPAGVNNVFSHGIALTPDEKELWVADQMNIGMHVFDVSGLPEKAPRYVAWVPSKTTIPRAPGWLNTSLDGRYIYAEGGDIIDRATKKVIGQLPDPAGEPFSSRWMLQVDFVDDRPVRAGDQVAIGRAGR